MVKRTTINLDAELVAQAREALGAKNTTDTVHTALREVVRRDRLRRLSERDWGMTLEDLKEMRRSRVETRPWAKLGTEPADPWRLSTPRESAPAPGEPLLDNPKKAA